MSENLSIDVGTQVDRQSLATDGNQLGRGGQGTVYSTSLHSAGLPLVFKEYNRQTQAALSPGTLRDMTTLVRDMPDSERDGFLARFAWPIAVVVEQGRTVGFLMPQVPGGFQVVLQSRRGTRAPVLAQFQFLLNPPTYLQNHGIALSHQDQFLLLEAVAEAMASLHRRGIIVGDLSPMNLLYSVDGGRHAAYFIDCDAMVRSGASVSPQAETPGWSVPAGEEAGTLTSDSYKFALLALRLLAGDQDTRDPGRLPRFARSLRALIDRGLAASSAQRPQPADWIPSLALAARRASRVAIDASTDLTGVGTARAESVSDRDQVCIPPAVPTGSTPTVPKAAARPGPRFDSGAKKHAEMIAKKEPDPPQKSKAGWYFAGAAAIIAVLVLGATGAFSDDKKASTQAATTSVPIPYDTGGVRETAPPAPVSTDPPEPEVEYMVAADGPPPNSKACDGRTQVRFKPATRPNVEGEHLKIAAGNTMPDTRCNFAVEVIKGFDRYGANTEFGVVSPNTNDTYYMTCRRQSTDPYIVRCDDGKTAVVYAYY